jgi:hypothetical protein
VLAGAVCSRTGVVGLYSWSGGAWSTDGFALGSSGTATTASVLRVEADGAGLSALVELRHGAKVWVVAAWQPTAGAAWVVSSELAVVGRLRATAMSATGTAVVTTTRGGVPGAATVAPPTAGAAPSWATAPGPPPGTAMVVDAGGTLVALSVESSLFRSYTEGDGSWVLRTSAKVPIMYGSST